MNTPAPVLRALLVDPSLFTAPYDAALSDGLADAGVVPTWAVRPVRPGDREELDPRSVEPFFYRWTERATWLPGVLRSASKGLAHGWGLMRLLWLCARRRPNVVHFQWAVVPMLDALAIRLLRTYAPVLLTVHDSVPFNGQRMSVWQRWGSDLPIHQSDRVIVHTRAGRQALVERGIDARKISVIPHGPLPLAAEPSGAASAMRDGRYTFVLFGELKPYKGLDVVIEALGSLPEVVRRQARVLVAGRARMKLAPLLRRIEELGLGGVIEVDARRLSDQEMADLFARADCFLLPYRQIDASGVYFLVKPLGKWLIASRVGIFAEDVAEGSQGVLLPPGSATALSLAMARAIVERPEPRPIAIGAAWNSIGRATSRVYQDTIDARVFGRERVVTEESTW